MATYNNKPPDTSRKDEMGLRFKLTKQGLAPETNQNTSMNYSRMPHDELGMEKITVMTLYVANVTLKSKTYNKVIAQRQSYVTYVNCTTTKQAFP